MDIVRYNRPKLPRNSYGYTSNTGGGSVSSSTGEIETHNFWGNAFTGKNDVNGEIHSPGIVNTGDIQTSTLEVEDTSTFNDDAEFNGDINANGNIVTSAVYPKSDNTYNLGSANYKWNKIFSNEMLVKNLTVTGTAHFFELMIDEIKAAGGSLIMSAADFRVDYMYGYSDAKTQVSHMLIGQKRIDDNGKIIINKWKVGDWALCQNFNVVNSSGTSSNKYFWGMVMEVDTKTINDVEYNTIRFDNKEYYEPGSMHPIEQPTYDGTFMLAEGDELVLFGHTPQQGETDYAARQNAILISAYKSPDIHCEAPCIIQYEGVRPYSMISSDYFTWRESWIKTKISPDDNLFTGNFNFNSDQIIAKNTSGETTLSLDESGNVNIGGNTNIQGNTFINGYCYVDGLVLSNPVHLTSSNYTDYCMIEEVDDGDEKIFYISPDFRKCGDYIIVDSMPSDTDTITYESTLFLPSIRYNDGTTIYRDLTGSMTEKEKADQIRRYRNCSIILINRSSIGFGVTGHISNEGSTGSISVVISAGKARRFTACYGVNGTTGKEYLIWQTTNQFTPIS